MKAVRRAAAVLAAVLACALLAEGAWFRHVLDEPRPRPRADMLAVYGGLPQRYAAGWAVEREGDFRYLVFSDASASYVQQMDKRFGPPRRARLLLEPDARTTAQNARYVARLARAYHCASLMVVTSWWHLPRALLLTHLALLGGGVDIEGWAADGAPARRWRAPIVRLEAVRVWGSLLTFESDSRHASSLFDGVSDY